MKKTLAFIASILILPILAFAINITVPSAPGSNYVLLSTSTGAYTAVATSSLGISGGSGTVTSVGLTVPTGLSVSGVPITSAGTIALGLQSGYNIPLTASTTAWNNFLVTPSSVIIAGTNLSWSGNTLNATGGGGSPAGSSGDIQYNNSGAFGGVTLVPLANGGTALANTITTLTTNGTITAMPVATSIIRYQSTSGATIEGIVAPSGSQRIILQCAFSSIQIILKNQNTGATAANRLQLQNGQDLTLTPGTQVELFYNTTDSRWEQSDFRSPVGVNNGLGTQNIFSNAGGIPTGVGDIVFGNGAVGAGTFNGSNAVILGTNAAKLAGNSNDLIAIGNGPCQGAATGSGEDICIGTNAGSSTSSGGEDLWGGADTGVGATTANENSGWGADDFISLTTGSGNEAFGFDAGGTNTTGNDNISIGSGTQLGSSNLSNTIGIGTAVRPTLSNTADIGGTSEPLDVGIDNDTAAYPLDVNGNINTNGQYLVNGVSQSPWLRTGNAGTTFGSDILGTTDATDFGIYTNGTLVQHLTATGLVGFQETTPKAVLESGTLSATIGSPASVFLTATPAASGYSFGSGDKDYAVYGSANIEGAQIYSTSGTAAHFTESPSSNFDPTGGSASFIGGNGYTASGYDFSGTVWALYGGQTLISVGNASVSDTGGDPNDGSQYDVGFSWGAPPGASPDAYLIQMGGSNPNSGQYQVVSGTSFDDNGSNWTSSASYGALMYTVNVSYTAGSAATSYRILNTTSGTFEDDLTPTQDVVDDGTWSSGSTVTPTTANYPSFLSDGDTELVGNGTGKFGIFNTTPSTQQTGDIGVALSNYGWVTSPTLATTELTGVLPESSGGTDNSTYSTGDILYASAANTLSKLSIGTAGKIVASLNGIPAWTATSTLAFGICGSNDLVKQISAVSSITTCIPTASTTLLISPYLTVNSIATDVEQLQVTYTDETNTSRTQILSTNNGLSSLTAIGAFLYPTISVRPMKNTAVTVLTVLTTSIGSINYDVGASIKYDR